MYRDFVKVGYLGMKGYHFPLQRDESKTKMRPTIHLMIGTKSSVRLGMNVNPRKEGLNRAAVLMQPSSQRHASDTRQADHLNILHRGMFPNVFA